MCMIKTVPTASLDFALGKLSVVYHKELGRARGLRMLSITDCKETVQELLTGKKASY